VAHCIVVTENAIRVQLPGGDLYAPALREAAAKTGARSGLPKRTAKALNDMVAAALAMLNSGGSSMITLEMKVHEASIEAKIQGKGCKSPTKTSARKLEAVAAKKSQEFEHNKTKSSHTVTFEV